MLDRTEKELLADDGTEGGTSGAALRIQFLGTGNARGVPVYGCRCPACRRARISTDHIREPATLMLESAGARILIDAGVTDLHKRFQPGDLDAVLLTHYHIDHIQGLFPLRWGVNDRLSVLGPNDPAGSSELRYRPGILDFGRISRPFEAFRIGDLCITPLPLNHLVPTLGYLLETRNRRIAYLTDTCGLPEPTSEHLQKHRPSLMILDCNSPPNGPTPQNHNNLEMALAIHDRVAAKQSLLTHIGHDLDSWLLGNEAPGRKNLSLASDGQVVLI